MTSESDTLARLLAYHDHIDLPAVAVEDDVRRGRRRVRRNRGLIAAGAALAVATLVVTGSLLARGDGVQKPQPIAPTPTPTAPTPTPTEPTSAAAARWEPPEPLRPAASRVVQLDHDAYGNALPWHDPRDAATAEIDIASVSEGQQFHGGSSWIFQLAARPPLDPADRIIAYGVVVDGDGDHRADCQIGINNDALTRGLYVWVTNLRTHETAVQDGGPYGMPVEFAHPAEKGSRYYGPEMQIGFLRGLKHPTPCDPFGDSSTFYAWSSVMEGEQIVARDYAPDSAWMPIKWRW